MVQTLVADLIITEGWLYISGHTCTIYTVHRFKAFYVPCPLTACTLHLC